MFARTVRRRYNTKEKKAATGCFKARKCVVKFLIPVESDGVIR